VRARGRPHSGASLAVGHWLAHELQLTWGSKGNLGAHVFFCYAREDRTFALELAGRLKARGVVVWVDLWDIPPTADWDRSIDRALADCAYFLIVLSPASIERREVRGELRTALDDNKPIVSVLYKPCLVPRQLRVIQQIDFVSRAVDDEVALGEVLRAVGLVAQPPSGGPAVQKRVATDRSEPAREAHSATVQPESGPGVLRPESGGRAEPASGAQPAKSQRHPLVWATASVAVLILAFVLWPEPTAPAREMGALVRESNLTPSVPETIRFRDTQPTPQVRREATPATAATIVILRHEGWVSHAEFSPDGRHVVTASWDGRTRVWDAASGRRLAVYGWSEGRVDFATFSPNGHRVLTTSDDSTAKVFEVATGRELAELRHADVVSAAAFSPDGQEVVTASYDHTARLWDAATGRALSELRHRGEVESAVFSSDGRWVVTASSGDGTARVWDVASGRPLGQPLPHHGGAVMTARFSHDGRLVVTASYDGTARVWDAATGAEVSVLRHDRPVVSAEFSPDGRRVVTTSLMHETARVWDTATGKEVSVLRGHTGWVFGATFSPSGGQVVTASQDSTARVWEVGSGRAVAVLRGHAGSVLQAVFSPDGRQVLTASTDGAARLWRLE